MIKAQYTSFEDIDRDLKILKLQRQIDEEQVKLAVHKTKRGIVSDQYTDRHGAITAKIGTYHCSKKTDEQIQLIINLS